MSQSWYEGIYHGECEHLFTDDIQSSDCVKRYFDIFDPYKEKIQRIIVCNESMKLLVRQKQIEKEENNYWGRSFQNVVSDIADQYTVIKIQNWMGLGTSANPMVHFCVCNRPYLNSQIKLFEAVRIISTWNYHNSIMHGGFKDRVIDRIKHTAEYYYKYRKYQYQGKEIRRLIMKLDRYCNCYTEEIYKDIFLAFFEIQVSINTKYGIK